MKKVGKQLKIDSDPKVLLRNGGYLPKSFGRGFVREDPWLPKNRYHAFVIAPDRIEIHYDWTIEGKHDPVGGNKCRLEIKRLKERVNHYDHS